MELRLQCDGRNLPHAAALLAQSSNIINIGVKSARPISRDGRAYSELDTRPLISAGGCVPNGGTNRSAPMRYL